MLALLTTGCGEGGQASADDAAPTETGLPSETETASSSSAPRRGGTYRVGWESSFSFTAGLDPTAEYTAQGWSLYTLLTRKLVTYPGAPGQEGNTVVPDLATDLGLVSDDGLTWTFTLKDGIQFAPPVSREITSNDVAAAFDRIANPDIGNFGYPTYYAMITGFQDVMNGKATRISGIETPDDKTIVFHLDKPAGDFLYRIAMPAAGPLPAEVTKCFTKAGDYGRFVIATGPYMIEGSDQLDITSCDTMKPIWGFNPEKFLHLVRNPTTTRRRTRRRCARTTRIDSSSRSTRTPRHFRPSEKGDHRRHVRRRDGQADQGVHGERGPQDNLKLYPDDSIFYLAMNLTQPPFDDVHVRKAMNLVMDKTGLIRAGGGSASGEPATHILTPSLAPPTLDGYDPYATPDFAGDPAAAMEEMKQSQV